MYFSKALRKEGFPEREGQKQLVLNPALPVMSRSNR